MSREPELDPELEQVRELLDAAAAQERADLRAAEALERAPGSERVGELLQQAWGAPATDARRGGRRRWPALAAAAAILVFTLVLLRPWSAPRTDGPRGDVLADPAFALLEPPERATRWERIAWSGPSKATYRVRVRAAESGDPLLGPLLVVEHTELVLEPAATRAWPAKILVELELRLADGSWLAAPPRPSELVP